MFSKYFCVFLLFLLTTGCTPNLKSGHYASAGSNSDAKSQGTDLQLNVTGDGITSGIWTSNQKPFSGKLTSRRSFFGYGSFSIYIPECNKDLPVSINQTSEDLKVRIERLPACDIDSQEHDLHIIK